MGVPVEFNSVLALRRTDDGYRRRPEEYLPDEPKVGEEYSFRKTGQRIYQLGVPMRLVRTIGDEKSTKKVGIIAISEVRYVLEDDRVFTLGRYRILSLENVSD